MPPALPCTVRAVDTAHLLELAREAATHGFSQRLPVDWLQEHLAAEATHYLLPTLIQRLTHRPEMPVQWRCRQLLTVSTGEQIWGLLDILPDTFDKIPKSLDTTSKKEIVRRIGRAVTVRAWMERQAADAGTGGQARRLAGLRQPPAPLPSRPSASEAGDGRLGVAGRPLG
jgi:hypothetical protein